jgi:Zn-dependent protease with chaperone function
MKEFTQGSFFDGHSSQPFRVYAGFSADQKKIIFESTEINSTEWLISDLTPELTGSRITLRPLLDSEKVLIVEDGKFAETFFDYFRKTGRGSFYHRFIHPGSKYHISLVLGIALFISAGYFYLIPWLAEKAVDAMPVTYDEYLGKTFYENVISGEQTDSAATKALNAFGDQINFGTNRKLNFTVIESKEVNAFALPDGNIVVYSGILKKLKSYPQLAALLSHESSHVIYRHSMKEMCRNLSGYMVLSLITSDANGIMSVLASNVNRLHNLSYSRKFEQEADEKGFYCMTKNRIDPEGMMELFQILKQSESEEVPEFLSTHPLTQARIDYSKKLINSVNYTASENDTLKKFFGEIESSL